MRSELEEIALIEKYLNNELTNEERAQVEEKIKSDADFAEKVSLQKELEAGINDLALKQSITRARKASSGGSGGSGLSGGMISGIISVVVVLVGLTYFLLPNNAVDLPLDQQSRTEQTTTFEQVLPQQSFAHTNEITAVYETKDGIVFAVPEHCFVDGDGKPVSGNVNIEVTEALRPMDILKAGLSTKSGDQLLETGGMFKIDATANGTAVFIAPGKNITMDIPTDSVDRDMMLYTGKTDKKGNIDWIDPVEISNDLQTVDIFSLDFYPPNYENSLATVVSDASKEYTDSLYYSFAAYCSTSATDPSLDQLATEAPNNKVGPKFEVETAPGEANGSYLVVIKVTQPEGWIMERDQNGYVFEHQLKDDTHYDFEQAYLDIDGYSGILTAQLLDSVMCRTGIYLTYNVKKPNKEGQLVNSTLTEYVRIQYGECPAIEQDPAHAEIAKRINPAKIQAIWSDTYQNTLLATSEFQERLAYIFSTCEESLIDNYVNNMDKPMHEIDAMCAAQSLGNQKTTFLNFAKRKDGQVTIETAQLASLKQYYVEKQKLYQEAVKKTQDAFFAKQNELNQKQAQADTKHVEQIATERGALFQKEFRLNLCEAYTQLGKKCYPDGNTPLITPLRKRYTVIIPTTGFYNVDKAVLYATANRETLDYTDPSTGKKAVIKYEPVSVTVKNSADFDRVVVYLMPKGINSYMKLEPVTEKYSEKLNELITYDLLCIGFKNDEISTSIKKDINPKDYKVKLKSTTEKKLNKALLDMGRAWDTGVKMREQIRYHQAKIKSEKRLAKNADMRRIANAVQPSIFPCDAPARPVSASAPMPKPMK